ncbi:MAG: DUF2071 domain-containing protein [Acidobacteria bacterium]|nr:DUF2071 domain-containing protein [Acidobacteriota bacterium]
MGSVFLTAHWRSLAMLNYEVPPALLRPFVPNGVELDSYQGRTLASMVGFLFDDTKIRGVSVPFHQRFEEVNLRFYVKRRRVDGWVRGVVFIREIVPKFFVAAIANHLYHEKYEAMPMRHEVAERSARYEWQIGSRWNSLSVAVEGDPHLPVSGSEEEFITEHYWGYTAQPDGSTLEYQVAHPRWPVWRATAAILDAGIAALYGDAFVPYLSVTPSSALLANGSEVAVYAGVPLPPSDSPNG